MDVFASLLLAGQAYALDVDAGDTEGGSVDLEIEFIDRKGNLVLSDDGASSADAGSASTLDPLLTVTVNQTGTCLVAGHARVGEYEDGSFDADKEGGTDSCRVVVSTPSLPNTFSPSGDDNRVTFGDGLKNVRENGGDVVTLRGGGVAAAGSGRDTLNGCGGNDTMWGEDGGAGVDALQGNGGADTVRLLPGEAPFDEAFALDRILDFTTADVIDPSDLRPGALTFRGGAFTGAGQERIVDRREGGSGFQEVRVSLDVDAPADIAILVDTGGVTFRARDLILRAAHTGLGGLREVPPRLQAIRDRRQGGRSTTRIPHGPTGPRSRRGPPQHEADRRRRGEDRRPDGQGEATVGLPPGHDRQHPQGGRGASPGDGPAEQGWPVAALPPMERQIAQAIRERRVVEFSYHGEPRAVEPYALGRVAGRLTLRGWQSRKGWRSFLLSEVEGLEVSERFFDEPREGYAPDPRMNPVLAAV